MAINKEAPKRMFFGGNKFKQNNNQLYKKASLQACHIQIDPNSSDSATRQAEKIPKRLGHEEEL